MDSKKHYTGSGKNRELSDNSTNGDDPKKKCESSLNDSQNADNILYEQLSSPDCVAILVNCVKNVEKGIVEIFSKTEETKNIQINGEQHLLELNKVVTLISKKLGKHEREKVEREKIMKKCKKKLRICLPPYGPPQA